ncbi:unnamed protein product, partial [Rotaria sp. Silwood2]
LLNKIQELSSAKLADKMFTSENTNSLCINEQLNDKKCCLTMLLYQYFTKYTILDLIQINNRKYTIDTDTLHTFQWLLQQHRPSDTLSKISNQYHQCLNKFPIGNLDTFLQALNNQYDLFMTELKEMDISFKSIDKRDNYEALLDKVLGCPDLCPCCNRPCDVDHTQIQSKPGSKNNEHRCLSGHALRAMNGYKFEVTQEASLLMCDQIKNDRMIVVGARCYQWSLFKRDHTDWLFDSPLNKTELNLVHKKFLTIWTKIGPQICQVYRMKFVTHNTKRIPEKAIHKAYHFILLLDASASMGSENQWDYLMDAVKEFLDRRRELKTEDRFTIIVFSDTAEVQIEDQTVNQVDLEKIKFHDGGTSFSAAFACVVQVISKFKEKPHPNSIHQNFAIVFMTDGEDEYYSDNEINQLFNTHKSVIKKFWTLELSDGCRSVETLEKINKKMGGSFYDIQNAAGLVTVYAEVATSTAIASN